MTTEKRNDEIDLIELFQKMGNGLINIFNKFLNILYLILLFFVRKAVLIGIIIIVALATGYLRFKTSPRYFSSNIEATSNAISSIDMINYVNNLNLLFEGNNIQELQAKLNISIEELAKIKSVKAYKVIDYNNDGITDLIDFDEEFLTSDSAISKNRFMVKVEVYDAQTFSLIQESILNYINRNKYINELNTVRKKQLNELIVKLNSEISTLDSLKKVEYFNSNQKLTPQAGQLLVMNEKKTQLFHEQIITLYKQKQNFEKSLELNTDAITIIQDFSALSKIENNLMHYLNFYAIVGIILGIMIAILVENTKRIKEIISDSKKK